MIRSSRRALLGAGSFAAAALLLAGCGLQEGLRPRATPTLVPPPTAAPMPTASAVPADTPTALPEPTVALTATDTPTPRPKTVEWWLPWVTPQWMAASRAITDELRQRDASITVQIQPRAYDFGQAIEAIASGSPPDLFDPDQPGPFAARKALLALDNLIAASKISSSNYFPVQWDSLVWNGRVVAVPALQNGPELGFLVNLSQVVGNASPAPASWAELLAFGQGQTRPDSNGEINILGFDPLDATGAALDTVRDLTETDWYDARTHRVTLTDPSYVAFVENIRSYYQALGPNHLMTFREFYPGSTKTPQSGVCDGHQVSAVTGFGAMGDVLRNRPVQSWIFARNWVPSFPSLGRRVQRLGGHGLAIPINAREHEGAWTLLAFAASDAASQIVLDKTGSFALTRSFLKNGPWSSHPELQFDLQSITQADKLTGRSTNPVATLAAEIWQRAIAQIALGKVDIAPSLAAAEQLVQRELDRALAAE